MYEERAHYDREFADYQKGMDIPLETWKQMAADYYGLCSYVDYETGRLILPWRSGPGRQHDHRL
jgi:arylsulfatase A-like enzyme